MTAEEGKKGEALEDKQALDLGDLEIDSASLAMLEKIVRNEEAMNKRLN